MRRVLPALVLLAACNPSASDVPVSGPPTTDAPEVLPMVVDRVPYQHPPTTTTTTAAPTTTHTHPTTTAVVPLTTSPPVTAAPARSGSCGGWRATVAAHFANVSEACSVLMCESNGNPRAHNPSGASGLFQVMPLWAGDYQRVTGVPYYDGRFDGPANIRFAAWLFGQSGTWSHWVCKP